MSITSLECDYKIKEVMKMKDVVILTGAGQIGMAIARRVGYGKKIVIGDKNLNNAKEISKTMIDAGFDVEPIETDISSRASILNLIEKAKEYGEITMLINAAGVSPSQASIEAVLKVDLYGTAVLLEEVGKVIKAGGVGVTISSQSGHRMPALSAEIDELLACTPTDELLNLEVLKPENIRDTLHAYQMAKRCNVKRVMSESVKWGAKGARINSISPPKR
jgi:NAD(P)-dependent dehydrogenase (short-subunit alcohol dehydrogenase family)